MRHTALLLVALGACTPHLRPATVVAPVDTSDVTMTETEEASTPPETAVSADLRALVIDLAAQGEVTSAGVGYSGEKSASYAAYEALVAVASTADLEKLLDHPSPVVRAYVAGHLAMKDGASLDAIDGALRDRSSIDAQYGCMGHRTSVAAHVTTQLCGALSLDLPHRGDAEQRLATLAADPTAPSQAAAARCLHQYAAP
ncbi:MAG: hypothetical protein KC731_12345 [Myxococcales bacterium]|nr:hypothetical protein [Myxococcales bacterium]